MGVVELVVSSPRFHLKDSKRQDSRSLEFVVLGRSSGKRDDLLPSGGCLFWVILRWFGKIVGVIPLHFEETGVAGLADGRDDVVGATA